MGVMVDMIEAVRSGATSGTESVRQSLDRIAALNDRVGAFISVSAERALERAGRIDDMRSRGELLGPLAGVPVAVKDHQFTPGNRRSPHRGDHRRVPS